MATIKKFNNISDVIYQWLDKSEYSFLEEKDEGTYDAAIVRSAELGDMEFPEGLLAIARAGAGYNNIPVDRCAENGIVVFNTPGANANAVKELVLCGLFLCGRDLISANKWVDAQKTEGIPGVDKNMEKAKKKFVGGEIAGKTLGVLGLGAIGAQVANTAVRLGMNVIGYDPFLTVESALFLNKSIKIVKTTEEIFKTCDFITLHVPMNDSTKNMVNKDSIAMMKDGACILNFARAGLVNAADIKKALENGKLGRYATDFPTDELIGTKNLVAFPHMGASTPEAEDNCAFMAAKELDNYIRYGKIKNSVNYPAADMPFNGGYRVCIFNKNVTNMIGQFTSALANAGLNIEQMVNASRGNYSYNMIDVNEKPSEETLNAIKAIEGVIRVRVIG